jgi:hypothetical protein
MKKLLGIVVLGLLFINPSQADDVKEFQVDGISIGDSILEYYNEKKIKKAIKKGYYYKNEKFVDIFIKPKKGSTYKELQITIKPKDNSYIVHAIGGQIHYKNNIEECYLEKKKVVQEIKNLFSNNIEIQNYKDKHSVDKSGKSTFEGTSFFLKDGTIKIECFDWSKKYKYKGKSLIDKMMISIGGQEFIDFMVNEAYN